MLRIIAILLFSFTSIASISQTDYSPQLSAWKYEFSKQEFIVTSYNTILRFTLNANPKPGFVKINVLVRHEITNISTDCFKEKNKPKCN